MVRNPLFDAGEMEKERKVIYEEMKMRKDRPNIYVMDKVQSFLYGGSLGEDLIGTEKTMDSIDKEKMQKKFDEIYQPNNMVLCVVGNAELEEVVNFAEKNFESGKGNVPKQEIILHNKSKIETRKGIDQANLVFAYHVPIAGDKQSHTAKVLSTLMAEGMSSRLFAEIREKRNLAYSIQGQSDINKEYAHNLIYVGTTKENVEKVKELILKEFEKVFEGLEEKELVQVKEQIIGNHYISLEDSRVQMVNLLSYELDGNAEELYDFEKNISEVKLEDVKKLAKIKNYSFFALVPEK